jgi:probable DNA metabolism protein
MNDLLNDLFSDGQGGHQNVVLASQTDLVGFREQARRLLILNVPPTEVSWHCSDDFEAGLLTADPAPDAEPGPAMAQPTEPVQVPAGFLELCQSVVLHNEPARFDLLYRLLWRLLHEPGLRHDPLDPDRAQARQMAEAVRRDIHNMKAFVQFRTVQDDIFRTNPEGGLLHLAWFEPEHHIVETVAASFARRFAQMRWALLTPERCVEWKGASPRAEPAAIVPGQLSFSPGANKADAPSADASEQRWLTFYKHLFSPARLKFRLAAESSSQRIPTMIDDAPLTPKKRSPASRPEGVSVVNRQRASSSLDLPGLAALAAAMQTCRDCPIGEHATQAVCGEGPEAARLMVVGEQPGDQEDLQGRPFVGPAGKLFDRALAELGVDRSRLFVTNAVKHFKYELRGKRRMHKTPTQTETAICAQWMEREIALVKPEAALALGATAAASLMGRRVAVMTERGQWLTRLDGLRVLVTLHPAALLRMEPGSREVAYAGWLEDLKVAFGFEGSAGMAGAQDDAHDS